MLRMIDPAIVVAGKKGIYSRFPALPLKTGYGTPLSLFFQN
jgi:hypothetical protein